MPVSTLPRKPKWLYRPIPGGKVYSQTHQIVKEQKLHTVCESASCPNLGECWDRGTATFMILGNICTRGCRFCDVPKGVPMEQDTEEPWRVAESILKMKLKYVVITSVNRDDLIDQGSNIWKQTLLVGRELNPDCFFEVLVPDMQGSTQWLDIILEGQPHVLNHNFETVARLQKKVRGRANLKDSTIILKQAKEKGFVTKTSFMLGMGETQSEVKDIIRYCKDLELILSLLGNI